MKFGKKTYTHTHQYLFVYINQHIIYRTTTSYLCFVIQDIETPESDSDPDSNNFEAVEKQKTVIKEPPPPPEPQGPTVDEETLKKVDVSAKELDKCQLTLKKEVKDGFEG